MPDPDPFPPDYFAARGRFRAAAARLGWAAETHPIDARGPGGEELTIDVAVSPGNPGKALVLSAGVHGVEGAFGSAVMLAAMAKWAADGPPPVRVVLIHALNPFGFAHSRRFDENGADPNRNFLLPDETFAGAPAGYAGLDPVLNPPRPPSRWEPFALKAVWAAARYGWANLRQAIAAGQYDFPRGLFFGGHGPSQSNRIMDANFARWLGEVAEVMHLDFHTGLGPWGGCKLLIDYPLTPPQTARLADGFGPDSFEAEDAAGVGYVTRGGFGRWCGLRGWAADYLFACAEFGTYGPVTMLGGLRAENRAHHWGADPATRDRVKARLRELFVPADPGWRRRVLATGLDLVDRAVRG